MQLREGHNLLLGCVFNIIGFDWRDEHIINSSSLTISLRVQLLRLFAKTTLCASIRPKHDAMFILNQNIYLVCACVHLHMCADTHACAFILFVFCFFIYFCIRHDQKPQNTRTERARIPLCESQRLWIWHGSWEVCGVWRIWEELVWHQHRLRSARHQLWTHLFTVFAHQGKETNWSTMIFTTFCFVAYLISGLGFSSSLCRY